MYYFVFHNPLYFMEFQTTTKSITWEFNYTMDLNYLSTFTGVGGFDLGLDQAGMKCVGQVEIDPHCRNVLRYHYPNVERKKDASKRMERL